jgi:hypothetical protein
MQNFFASKESKLKIVFSLIYSHDSGGIEDITKCSSLQSWLPLRKNGQVLFCMFAVYRQQVR